MNAQINSDNIAVRFNDLIYSDMKKVSSDLMVSANSVVRLAVRDLLGEEQIVLPKRKRLRAGTGNNVMNVVFSAPYPQALKELSRKRKVTISGIIRYSVEKFLKAHENKSPVHTVMNAQILTDKHTEVSYV